MPSPYTQPFRLSSYCSAFLMPRAQCPLLKKLLCAKCSVQVTWSCVQWELSSEVLFIPSLLGLQAAQNLES